MTDNPTEQARQVITRLRENGHPEPAARLERSLATGMGESLLLALRETCQTVLTAIEALDPVSEMMLEDLRLTIDRTLTPDRNIM